MEQNPAALAAINAVRDLGGDADGVLEGFATAKRMLEGRFKQYTSFLSQSPWTLVALLGYLLPSGDASAEIHKSRTLALKLLKDHDAGRLGNTGEIGQEFFKVRGRHRIALERWGRGIDPYMNQQLFRELVAYSSSLLVMQRLEAKHHLIHVAILLSKCGFVCFLGLQHFGARLIDETFNSTGTPTHSK